MSEDMKMPLAPPRRLTIRISENKVPKVETSFPITLDALDNKDELLVELKLKFDTLARKLLGFD